MTRVYTYSQPIDSDIVDGFCLLQKGFTDQFVYYDKQSANRYMGLGRCIALPQMEGVEYEIEGPIDQPPVFFSFNRFDAENPKATDELFEAFPRLKFMLPEMVLVENERGRMLQVNSLSPVYPGRIARFARQVAGAPRRERVTVPFTLERDSREQWRAEVDAALSAIRSGRVGKVVLSRRQRLLAEHPFSSKDLLVNLIDGDARGTVLLYRYADVFFCGCTPELLLRKKGTHVESMCLAGTCPHGETPEEQKALADELLGSEKNRREHEYVVKFMREVFARNCYNVDIPTTPQIKVLKHVQHLHTPAAAQVMEGTTLMGLASQLHPTPALSGTPVGEALMTLREAEGYNRGFFGGAVGYVNADGDGEFSVAIRSGVFDGERGWLYAGCGIVEGSDAAAEFNEIDLKLKTILSAFEAPEDEGDE